MYQIKSFKTRNQFNQWVKKNDTKTQWQEVFV